MTEKEKKDYFLTGNRELKIQHQNKVDDDFPKWKKTKQVNTF